MGAFLQGELVPHNSIYFLVPAFETRIVPRKDPSPCIGKEPLALWSNTAEASKGSDHPPLASAGLPREPTPCCGRSLVKKDHISI